MVTFYTILLHVLTSRHSGIEDIIIKYIHVMRAVTLRKRRNQSEKKTFSDSPTGMSKKVKINLFGLYAAQYFNLF